MVTLDGKKMNKNRAMERTKIPRKRLRIAPQKKWRDTEVDAILNYVLESEEFEKPTAHMYYDKMISTLQLKATWDLLKNKMRNLKTSLRKTIAWKNAKIAEGVDEATIQDTVKKMCPFYKKLMQIYAGKIREDETTFEFETSNLETMLEIEDNTIFSSFEQGSSVSTTESFPISSPAIVMDNITEPASPLGSDMSEKPFPTLTTTEAFTETTSMPTTNPPPRDYLRTMLELERDRNDFYKNKLEIEKMKLEIEKEKLKIQHEELRLKEETIKNKSETAIILKRMELEHQEKIAKYELDLKYNNNR